MTPYEQDQLNACGEDAQDDSLGYTPISTNKLYVKTKCVCVRACSRQLTFASLSWQGTGPETYIFFNNTKAEILLHRLSL